MFTSGAGRFPVGFMELFSESNWGKMTLQPVCHDNIGDDKEMLVEGAMFILKTLIQQIIFLLREEDLL